MKVRVVTTASRAKAVQVVHYQYDKRKVMRHLGSAHTDSKLCELLLLVVAPYFQEKN